MGFDDTGRKSPIPQRGPAACIGFTDNDHKARMAGRREVLARPRWRPQERSRDRVVFSVTARGLNEGFTHEITSRFCSQLTLSA